MPMEWARCQFFPSSFLLLNGNIVSVQEEEEEEEDNDDNDFVWNKSVIVAWHQRE